MSVANMATKWPPRGTVDPREWERNGMPSVPPALVAVVSLHEPPDSDPHAPDKDVPQHASKGEGDDEKEKTEEAECTPTWRESVRAFVQRLQVRDITVVLVDSVDGGPFRNRDAQSHHDDAAAAADRSNLALTVAAMRGPRVYVSIGGTAHDHACMWRLPGRDRRRWVHRDHPDGLEAHNLYYCWLTATDPLPPHLESRAAAAMVALGTTASTPPGGDDDGDDDDDGDTCRFSTSRPLVSVFTSSYRSGDKIMRLYDSLLRQTYENWELVIVDDSGDGEETYREWL
ncbi:MAG TPA: glycosyltransferase, partial [Rariglobus sp.]